MKNLPLLRTHVPKSQTEVTAYQIMSTLVLTVEGIVSVEFLVDILQKPFSQYPVMNSAGNIVGMMPKAALKEKLLAAHRAGIRTLILPKDNQKDLADIPANILQDFAIHFVENMDEVLKVALIREPVPLLDEFPTSLDEDSDLQKSVM